MERKGGRGLPRAQGESPLLWIDLMEERRSRESFLLCAPGRDNLGLSRGSAPRRVAPGHLQMISSVEFTLHHHGCVREGIPGGCPGAVGRRGAACFPGKDKQQVLGCSAPGALSCNRKSGSKSSLASAPPPESVTKQQGTTELSNVPLPKSAAPRSKVW